MFCSTICGLQEKYTLALFVVPRASTISMLRTREYSREQQKGALYVRCDEMLL